MHPLNHRKRNSDAVDDDQELTAARISSSPKRPRIDTLQRPSGTMYSPLRTPSDIEDIGIVVTRADPGPSSGSLLRERPATSVAPKRPLVTPTTPVVNSLQPDYSSHHIPSMTPLINRQTLRELDLDVIIRNPVLRHDLLFDAGLQFRPRRKRDLSEKYWNAVWEEVKSGCTCITLEYRSGKPLKTVCMCSRSAEPTMPPATPLAYLLSSAAYTIRMPSRIRALLTEFLEVMLFVIQPLSNTAVYSNPNDVREQAREHSQHAAYLREIFDPELIYQELMHKAFDPSGLFQHIGEMLKNHCAPMRDRTVDELVRLAQQPGVEGLKAFRASLELLEQMKLDIANHQLTQLRPWLLRNTGSFEIKAFKMRFGPEPSLHNTREWLHSTHSALMRRVEPISHPAHPEDMFYQKMTRNQQVYMAVLRGVVDIVFDSWISSSTSPATPTSLPPTPVTSAPSTPLSSTPPALSTSTPASKKPETLYLDKTRLANYSTEAADVTALYMFMLLFRQLAFIDLGEGASTRPVRTVDEEDILQLRQELLDIGSTKMGSCFVPPLTDEEGSSLTEKQKKDFEQKRSVRMNLVLQIAKRASDLRRAKAAKSVAFSNPVTHLSSSPVGDAPDQRLVNIALRWTETNMQPGSTLSVLLHNRMREVLFDLVVSLAYPGKDVTSLAAAANGTLRVPGSTAATPISTPIPPAPKNPLPLLSMKDAMDTSDDSPAYQSPTAITSSSIIPDATSTSDSTSTSTGTGASTTTTTIAIGATSTTTTTTTLPQLKVDLYASTRALATTEAITDNHQPGMEGALDEARELAEKVARMSLIHLNTFLGMYESDGFFVDSEEAGSNGGKWADERWRGGFGDGR